MSETNSKTTPGSIVPKPSQLKKPTKIVAPLRSDPEMWGRVDDDGSAWVKTNDGERLIGTWQAGAPEEGLAHFARRYDDMATEVALLERRLDTQPTDAANTRKHAEDLLASLANAAVIGDLNALSQRLTAVIEKSFAAEEKAHELRQQRRKAAIARKTALVEEAEEIGAKATSWKKSGDRLRDILEEWKTIHGIDRKTDDVLWKRFSRAREAFNRRRGSYFAELDRARAEAARLKEDIIAEAEKLQDSEEWGSSAEAYRELMGRWKKAGRAQKEVDDALWMRFKQAQDNFFDRRNAAFAERDSEFSANAQAKTDLLEKFQPLIRESKNAEKARQYFRMLSEEWDQIGRVPRQQFRILEDSLRNLEKYVSDREEIEWQRTDPAVQARAQQFWDRVKEFEEMAQKAEKANDAKAREEAIAQANQWREWAKAAENSIDEL